MYKTFKQSMKVQYRIKNDLIGLDWKIYRKYGVPENFNDPNIITESIILEIRHRQIKSQIIKIPFKFENENVVKIDFLAKDQEYTGSYDLFLQYKAIEDGVERTFTLDKPYAFELVKSSAFINIPEDRLIYEGILEVFEGLSAYEVALKNGFEGTEREWLESLAISGDSIYMMDRDDIVFKNDLPTKVSELENDKGYLTEHQDLSNLATKSELPTKVSELINDSEYLTEHQSLDGYATEQYVDNKINNIPEVDLSEYAKRNELFDKDYNKLINKPDSSIYLTEHQSLTEYAKKTEIPSLDNYATKPFVIDEINKINLFSGNYNDLSNKPNLNIYLTEHQSLSHLATRNELNAKADKIDLFSKNYDDLTNKPRIPNIVADLFDGADYAKKTDLFSGRYSDLKNKPDLSIYLTEHQNISHLATKDYVDNKFNDIEVPEIDVSNLATKNELNTKADKGDLNAKQDTLISGLNIKTINNVSLLGTGNITIEAGEGGSIFEESDPIYQSEKHTLALKSELFNKDYNELINKPNLDIYLTEHQDISNLASKDEIPNIEGLASEDFVIAKIEDIDIPINTSELVNDSGFIDDISHLASKVYVDDKIANIEIGGGVDLSDYALKSELFDKNYNSLNNKPDLSIYLTEHQSLEEYAKKLELFSKNYDDLLNKPDLSIYLTEHQDISHLATKSEIPSLEGLIYKSEVMDDYVPKTLQIAGNKLNKDISAEDIKTAIGNATISNNGLLSSEDKVRLNTLAELLNDQDGEFVDTLEEILSIFSRYPEGLDIIEKFSEKVDKVDGKGLSTNDFTNELKSNYDSAYTKSLIEYALKEHTHNQYLTEHQDISNLALKSEIPSIAGLASEQYVDNKIDNLDIPEVDLSNYAKKSELFDKDYNKLNNKPNIPSIEGLATESYVDNKVANVETSGSGIEISDTEPIDPNVSVWIDTSGEGIDLTDIATKNYVDDKIEEIDFDVDLSDYALKSELFSGDYNDLINKPSANTFTGSTIDLSNIFGSYQVSTVNNSTTYTVINEVIGAWAKIKINASSEPVVSNATLIEGSEFEANADMYLLVGYNGVDVEYYFISI